MSMSEEKRTVAEGPSRTMVWFKLAGESSPVTLNCGCVSALTLVSTSLLAN
jgi:hypothetical protein